MCWTPEISLVSALLTWCICYYLYKRNINYDQWAAKYLFTFTFTQIVDIILWLEHKRVDLLTCSNINYGVSKFIIPLVVYSQYYIQCLYPSNKLSKYRTLLQYLHLLPMFGMMYQFHCSTIMQSLTGDTLCWGNSIAEMYQILIVSGLVGVVFAILMPTRVAIVHCVVLLFVMTTLYTTEGTLALGSKWCSYCLVYSIVYLADPYWAPAGVNDTNIEVETKKVK